MSFHEEWARCASWLEAALAHAGPTHRLEDVARLVRSGDAQFWPAADGAAVTLIEDDPLERRLLVWLAGGRLETLREQLLPRIQRWAAANGCRRLLIIGRAGWERALRADHFAPLARILTKDLGE